MLMWRSGIVSIYFSDPVTGERVELLIDPNVSRLEIRVGEMPYAA